MLRSLLMTATESCNPCVAIERGDDLLTVVAARFDGSTLHIDATDDSTGDEMHAAALRAITAGSVVDAITVNGEAFALDTFDGNEDTLWLVGR